MLVPATQEAILAAAKKVLQERGLEGFTTNAVAARSPFSVGTVHNYFPDRGRLLHALIQRECEALEPWLRSPPHASNQTEYVSQIIIGLLAYHRGAPQLAWFLYVEERRQDMRDGLQNAIQLALAKAMGPPNQPPGDSIGGPGELFAILWGMAQAASRSPTTDVSKVTARMVATAMHYIRQGSKGA